MTNSIGNSVGEPSGDVIDVTPKTWWTRAGGKKIAILLLAILAASMWCANRFWIEPARDERLVNEALRQLESDPSSQRWVASLRKMEPHDRLLETIGELSPYRDGRIEPERVGAYEAAFKIAMRAGLLEAKLKYGVALRDGVFGPRDMDGALKLFDQVAAENASALRAGDSVAMYIQALILSEGLGVPQDRSKAIELAKRAGPGLDGTRLERVASDARYGVGIFDGASDYAFTEQMASRMISSKMDAGPSKGAGTCLFLNFDHRYKCELDWYRRGVDAGITAANAGYALALLRNGYDIKLAEQWFSSAAETSSPSDRKAHAVVRAMLATNDLQLMEALTDMWRQVKANREFGLDAEYDYVTFVYFEHALRQQELHGAINLFIAARVHDELSGNLPRATEWLREILSDRPDLTVQLNSADVIRKSKIAAGAIRAGIPANQVSFSRTPSTPTVMASERDPEQQESTGYIKGQLRGAGGGLSTFTVDNRKGANDATARIYLDGKKPAVRSMYVKLGETFKAESLAPGTYTFRYRFIGSDKTYESDKQFELTQAKTETGTRYSNVTVTLFTVTDGNMRTKEVDPSAF